MAFLKEILKPFTVIAEALQPKPDKEAVALQKRRDRQAIRASRAKTAKGRERLSRSMLSKRLSIGGRAGLFNIRERQS